MLGLTLYLPPNTKPLFPTVAQAWAARGDGVLPWGQKKWKEEVKFGTITKERRCQCNRNLQWVKEREELAQRQFPTRQPPKEVRGWTTVRRKVNKEQGVKKHAAGHFAFRNLLFLLDVRSENSLKNIFFFLCLKVQILLLEEGSDSHRGPQTLNKAVIQWIRDTMNQLFFFLVNYSSDIIEILLH